MSKCTSLSHFQRWFFNFFLVKNMLLHIRHLHLVLFLVLVRLYIECSFKSVIDDVYRVHIIAQFKWFAGQ